MTLQLIIKGDHFVTAQAAANRGVPFAVIRKNNRDITGRTGDEHLAVVEAWFAELPADEPLPDVERAISELQQPSS